MTLQSFFTSGKPARLFKEEVQAFSEPANRIDYSPLGEDLPFIDLHMRALSDIRLFKAHTSPYRNRVLDAGDAEADYLLLGLCEEGVLHAQQKGTVIVHPGHASLIQADRPGLYGVQGQPARTMAIGIPREMLALHLSGLDGALQNGIKPSAELHLLQTYAASLMREETFAASGAEALFATHITDLLNLVLGAGKEATETGRTRGGRMAKLMAIKADIAANITSPDLSLAWLAARHAMNPRALRNLFYGEGTNITDYILNMRLERAHSMLLSADNRNSSIISVAMEAGFEDISWFNRAFRRRFGMTPRDTREAADSGP